MIINPVATGAVYLALALPLQHELADLAADAGQHVDQVVVRLAHLGAEELHHAQQLAVRFEF